jgi:hypothetical protein
MAELHVISALVRKRGELLGDIEHYEKIVNKYKEDLNNISKTILIFDENYDLSTINPRKAYKNRYFKNGEAKTLILDALRNSDTPLKTDDIALQLASKKEIDLVDNKHRQTFNKTILSSLTTLEKNDLVKRINRDGISLVWQIVDID